MASSICWDNCFKHTVTTLNNFEVTNHLFSSLIHPLFIIVCVKQISIWCNEEFLYKEYCFLWGSFWAMFGREKGEGRKERKFSNYLLLFKCLISRKLGKEKEIICLSLHSQKRVFICFFQFKNGIIVSYYPKQPIF